MGRRSPQRMSSVSRRVRGVIMLLVLGLVAVISLPADGSIAGASTVVAIGAQGDGSDTIRRVALSSIEIYLEQEGVAVFLTEERPTDESLSRAIARQGSQADAEFALHGLLSVSGSEVEVELRLFLLEGEQLLATATSVEPIGLTLDRAIAGLTGSLVERARPYLEAAATDRAQSGTIVNTQDDGFSFSQPGEGELTRTVPLDRVFAAEVSYAPFLPIDLAASYVASSLSAASVTLLAMPFAQDALGLGLSVRAILSTATGAATDATLQMLPMGVAARLSGEPDPYAPFVLVSAGAALLRADNPTLGTFVSFAPALSGALGFRIEFERLAGAQVYVGFDAILEGSVAILGFSPGIGLALWF